nr:RNA polymerase ECF-type sigma factor, putative [Kibdelosporangium sp. MJ126-NF4]CTQ98215.1 RNA polymerase ECF-type sigma factor, putative [Kibdelosporangium sp. MJ126-NF4]
MYRKLHRIAARHVLLLDRHADVEAIVQDVLAKMWEIRDTFTDDDHRINWVIAAARNRYFDYQRKTSQERPMLDPASAIMERLAQVTDESDIACRELWEEVDFLPDIEKSVLIMSRFDGLTHEQIANRLDISIRTVSRKLEAARKKLKKRLGRAVPELSSPHMAPGPPVSADDDDDRDGEGAR